MDEFAELFLGSGLPIPVRHIRSGKLYVLEHDVYYASLTDTKPFVYVWPVAGRKHSPVWCYLENLRPV